MDPARMIAESLTPSPGIREQYRSKAASMRGSCWCAALFQLTKTLLVRLAARVMMSAGSAAPRLPNAGRKLEH